MSNTAIALALETALVAASGSITTAWENVDFAPPDAGYQVASILFAEPDNPTLGPAFFRQRGMMQVQLRYPLGTGKQAAVTRAEALRAAFNRGLTFAASGITVVIERTPEIATGYSDDNRFIVNVRVRFFANIGA